MLIEWISKAYEVASEHWVLTLLASIFIFSRKFFSSMYKERESRKSLVSHVRRASWRSTYQSIILRFLLRFDQLVLEPSKMESTSVRTFRRSFSLGLFELNLALSMIYPMGFYYVQLQFFSVEPDFAQWWIGGHLKGLNLFGAVVGMVGLPVIGWFCWKAKSYRSRIAYIALSYAWGATFIGMFAGSDFGLYINPSEGATVGFAFAYDLMGPATLSIAIFSSIAFTSKSLGPRIFLLSTIGVCLLDTFHQLSRIDALPSASFNWGPNFYQTIIVLGFYFYFFSLMFVSLFSVSYLLHHFLQKQQMINSRLHGLIFIFGAFSILALHLYFFHGYPPYLLILILLPILNACFDFISTAATRFTLRQGVRKIGLNTILWAAVDLFLGILLSVGLLLTCYFFVELFNSLKISGFF